MYNHTNTCILRIRSFWQIHYSNYMQYVMWDTIKHQYVLTRACTRRNGNELEAGVDSDRTSRKFKKESIALQNREAPFNRAHCTSTLRQRLNRLPCTFRVIRPGITTHLTSPELVVTFTIAASRHKLRRRIARRRRTVNYGVRNFCRRFRVTVVRWKHRPEKKLARRGTSAPEHRGGGWKKNSFERGEGSQMGEKYEVMRFLNIFRKG